MNPFEVLGVPNESDIIICKKAYRSLSKMYHPDNKITGDLEKFHQVSKAWGIIEGSLSFDDSVRKQSHLSHASLFKYFVV